MAIGTANKDDLVADALEAITGFEWRRRRDGYDCRVNHTHAKGLEQTLLDLNIPVTKEVSAERSGRYLVFVSVNDGQLIINAAERLARARKD